MRTASHMRWRGWVLLPATLAATAVLAGPAVGSSLPSGYGVSANYIGDAGIENDPNVVFVENFETGTIDEIAARWGFIGHRRQFSLDGDVPEGSAGSRSLKITTTRDTAGTELYKTFDEGWEKIHLRFNVKFAEDYGRHSHFVALRGHQNPSPIPGVGVPGAGQLAEDHFTVKVETAGGAIPQPPGRWHFYAYWPEMRSWQTELGEPDGRANPYYGNSLPPEAPRPFPARGEWMTVEMMLKMNSDPSDPDNRDGELALWLDGDLVAHFAPGIPELGHWRRDSWYYGPADWLTGTYGIEDGPFEGFRWRHEGMEDVLINILRLQHYVSRNAFDQIQAMADDGWDVNTEEAIVWFDNVVMATEYIGPMKLIPEPGMLGVSARAP